MARQVEVIQHVWCDPCMEETPEGEETRYVEAVREVPLVFGARGKRKLLAICELHDKEVVQPLQEWYTRLAQEDPDKPARRASHLAQPKDEEDDRPVESCTVPGCSYAGKAPRSHWKSKHDGTIKQSYDQYVGIEVPYVCDECPRAFRLPQSLAVHKSTTHRRNGK